MCILKKKNIFLCLQKNLFVFLKKSIARGINKIIIDIWVILYLVQFVIKISLQIQFYFSM